MDEMTSIEGRVQGFIETWAKRHAGALPMPDSVVSCSRCGVRVIGDEKVEFTNGGIVCIPCFDRSRLETRSGPL
jgi:hypothetical protein